MKSNKPAIVLVEDNVLIKNLPLEQKEYTIGRSDKCDFMIDGNEISRQHARIKFKDGRYIIEDLKSTNGTLVNGEKIERQLLKHGDEITIGDFTILFDDGQGIEGIRDETRIEKSGEETKRIEAQYKTLTEDIRGREAKEELKQYHHDRKKERQQAKYDRLTGLFNRRFFDEEIIKRINSARDTKMPLTLLFIDLDFFKKINDSFGRDKGDETLKQVARLVRAMCRQEDIVARYGGEEFVVIFSKMTADNAYPVAESIRKTIDEKTQGLLGFTVTVSIGIATFPEHAKEIKELVRKADQALYKAKSLGRNRVVRAYA